ncbi:hypothetical protein PGTUg99_001936 [Puccinia graminis f. sp. tritici]|uniref:Large ribosomal subunit protein uL6 alpha-beta domain-containing protein n=1 Tax=Puccinia graminis f. sp. tritici TaxID=56615 RepID=A0A5B0M3F8_PUCGR|nr:hypothetical protein PGTUg99_008087 [Puccinia graminis f. sp. tritici]KAA1077095.1 hypothetical protein PGTUg99_001936 [Puccinia graminis f. sp. tritici]
MERRKVVVSSDLGHHSRLQQPGIGTNPTATGSIRVMMSFNLFTVSASRASHLIATPPLGRSVRLTVRQFSVTINRASHIGSKPIDIPPEVTLSFSYPVRPRTSTSAIPYGYPQISVKGKLGKLDVDVLPFVTFTFESPTTNRILGADLQPTPLTSPGKFVAEVPTAVPQDVISGPGLLKVNVADSAAKKQRGIWGLTRALMANAVHGVTEAFTSSLELVGVGYRASLEDIPPHPNQPANSQPKRQRLNLRVGYSHPVLINLPDSDTFLSCEVPSPNRILLKGIDKQELGLLGAGIRKWRPPEPYNGKGIYLNNEIIKRKEVKKK